MTREEAIEVYHGLINTKIKEAFEFFAPELAESEDEMIRKRLINLIKELATSKVPILTGGYFVDGQDKKYIAWLEKQKVFAEHGYGLYYYHNGVFTFVARPAEEKDEENPYDFAMSQQEKQKEDLTPEEKMNHPLYLEGFDVGREVGKVEAEQKPAEWSEEDEAAYDAFMCEVVNEKMNPTIEQIKWLRAIRDRLKSLRPSWKPSEEQMDALLWCAAHLGGADHRVLAELYEHLKKLM